MGIRALFKRITPWVHRSNVIYQDCLYIAQKWSIKDLAIESAINVIASILSQAEIRTYEKGEEVKKKNYYLLNVRPNTNENATVFFKKIVSNLIRNNGALVLLHEDNYLVADSYELVDYAFKPNVYKNIYVNGLKLNKVYTEEEVLHFTLSNERMLDLIDSMYSDYEELLKLSQSTYKRSNSRRGILDIPTNYPQTVEAQQKLKRVLEEHLKEFMSAEGPAVLPLTNGLKYQDLTNQTYKNGSDSRDIRQLIDDIFDYVASALGIPVQILKGTVADNENLMNSFFVTCINPIKEILEDEFNGKLYTERDYLDRTYLTVDTSMISVGSITQLAPVIEKLTRNGCNTLDDSLKMLKREPLNKEWSQKRYITLDLVDYKEGGEKNER